MRWAMNTNGSWWAFDSAHRLLNEVIAQHVDKVLGLRTVPPGKLVAIRTSVWARWFSDFVCAERFELADFLTSNVDIKSVTTDDPMVVLGWITNVVAPLVHKPTPLANLGCGAVEPNGSLAQGASPELINSVYEATLVGALTFRADQRSNCFATAATDADTLDKLGNDGGGDDEEVWRRTRTLTVSQVNQQEQLRQDIQNKWGGRWYRMPARPVTDLRAINLDNDKPSLRNRIVWKRPCSVPRYLRERVMRIDNFSAMLLDSIRAGEPLLAEQDFVRIQESYLKHAEPYFANLAAQFRKCAEV